MSLTFFLAHIKVEGSENFSQCKQTHSRLFFSMLIDMVLSENLDIL